MNIPTAPKDKAATKRMSISLPCDAAENLEALADMQGVTQVEALRRAIATEAYIQKSIKAGSRVLLHGPDKEEIRELIFR